LKTETPTPISLIGVLTDIGAGALGARMGPEALRVAGIAEALTRLGRKVTDTGNLTGPPNPNQPPVDGFRHLPEVAHWNRLVHDAVHSQLQLGHLPIMLGGDHSLAIGSISAVARHCRQHNRPLRILWLDAHSDFNTAELTPTGNIHGMPVSCLCGHGPSSLTTIGHHTPAILPSQIRQIGIRSVDPGEKLRLHQLGIEVFDMRYIDQHGMFATIQSALAGMDQNTHLHVSLDVDFADPSIAPGVGTTVRGGPTYREAQLAMELIADTHLLASLDIVELNPALDIQNQTAALAVRLTESLFGKSTLMRWPATPTQI
jgi:arginase